MSDPTMALPAGKTCRDCAHFERCEMLFSADRSFPSSTSCDWSPSRFVEPVRAARKRGRSCAEAVLSAYDAMDAAGHGEDPGGSHEQG